MRFHMIYPEDRWVNEAFICAWYADLLADGEIDDPGHEVDLYEAMDALSDLGVATFTDEAPRE